MYYEPIGTDMEENKRKVLIIDDDENIREYVKCMLEDEGFEVFVADNGRTGIDIFTRESIDLIITDLIMPEKEGIETIQDIRKIDKNCGIIAMSGVSNKDSYLSISSLLGAHAILHKPFKPQELMSVINEIFDRNTTE